MHIILYALTFTSCFFTTGYAADNNFYYVQFKDEKKVPVGEVVNFSKEHLSEFKTLENVADTFPDLGTQDKPFQLCTTQISAENFIVLRDFIDRMKHPVQNSNDPKPIVDYLSTAYETTPNKYLLLASLIQASSYIGARSIIQQALAQFVFTPTYVRNGQPTILFLKKAALIVMQNKKPSITPWITLLL